MNKIFGELEAKSVSKNNYWSFLRQTIIQFPLRKSINHGYNDLAYRAVSMYPHTGTHRSLAQQRQHCGNRLYILFLFHFI